MKKEAVLAKYRIEMERNDPAYEILKKLGANPRSYEFEINGNICHVIVSEEFGYAHISVSIKVSDNFIRVPNYSELLTIKDLLFEEDENLVFAFSRIPYMNFTITNPFCMHLYSYNGKMPPLNKILEIEDYKKDGEYKITKGRWGGWHFIRICGNNFPDMDELSKIKNKYANQKDVAIFVIKDAIIMLNNPNEGIIINKNILK